MFLNLFHQFFVAFSIQVFHLLKFISKYLILCGVIVNGTILLISPFKIICCLCIEMQMIFFMLIFYPATVLNSFISYNSTFMGSSGFFVCESMSFANRNNFPSSFPIWVDFITFCCLIVLPRPSSIMLNRSGERGHPLPFS